ncbi:MAG: hypothetical protein OJF61_001577 [Rhodanobacteraceae bacterium]|jgi:hypothetical protein|nr:MAG: hypothetical protein OJF61_001577 [Rhodanobacteraceae bacterium]
MRTTNLAVSLTMCLALAGCSGGVPSDAEISQAINQEMARSGGSQQGVHLHCKTDKTETAPNGAKAWLMDCTNEGEPESHKVMVSRTPKGDVVAMPM